MKTLILSIVALFLSIASFAQDEQLIKPGRYHGSITENDQSRDYILEFDTDGYAYQLSSSDTTRDEFEFKKTTSHNQITTLQWIDSGGSWTETQTFMITKLSNSVIQVFHIRYVVNKGFERQSWFYGNKALFYLEE